MSDQVTPENTPVDSPPPETVAVKPAPAPAKTARGTSTPTREATAPTRPRLIATPRRPAQQAIDSATPESPHFTQRRRVWPD
ncbi:MAG: hypothetical protein EOM91_01030 [Sphingobacteriia bacterium]|nr:hypothetical protein [Sphingobacteriia bacterium]NCC40700.1 hypothetical protein [Gammaproteobacteria bacterium]